MHRQSKERTGDEEYKVELEQLGAQIESVQDFWKYNNNTPVEQIKTRESIYLFKQGFRPVWEDRRNILGGAWNFRVPKAIGPEVWNHVQLLAIGEELQSALDSSMLLPPPLRVADLLAMVRTGCQWSASLTDVFLT